MEQHRTIRLTTERLDANRQWCKVGQVISPGVEGWPAHRVALAVRHGYAEPVEHESGQESVVDPPAAAAVTDEGRDPMPSRRQRRKTKADVHGL